MKKATKTAAKKATKKTAAKKVAVKKVAAKKAAVKATKKVAAKKVAAKKTPAKKAAKKTAKKTTIVASVNVGFGNSLYIRGDAPGLSWSKGVLLECESDAQWNISLSGIKSSFEYKLLINDVTWSEGGNDVAAAGKKNSVEPSF